MVMCITMRFFGGYFEGCFVIWWELSEMVEVEASSDFRGCVLCLFLRFSPSCVFGFGVWASAVSCMFCLYVNIPPAGAG